jgi:DDE superfamily endonuclease
MYGPPRSPRAIFFPCDCPDSLRCQAGGAGHPINFPAHVAEVRRQLTPGTPVEVWFQDEMRVGQKNKLTYRWARKCSQPRATHDQRTQSTYLFGAVCPEHGTGAALVLPACNSEAMQLRLDLIARKVSPGAHAIVILDQAGRHGARGHGA